MEASFRDFKDGDIVEGEVVKIDRDEVLLDIGYKSEGVIPSKELSIRHDVEARTRSSRSASTSRPSSCRRRTRKAA